MADLIGRRLGVYDVQSRIGAGELVCSSSTLDSAGPTVRATALGALAVKGRSSTVDAHRVTGIDA